MRLIYWIVLCFSVLLQCIVYVLLYARSVMVMQSMLIVSLSAVR